MSAIDNYSRLIDVIEEKVNELARLVNIYNALRNGQITGSQAEVMMANGDSMSSVNE